MQKRKRFNFVDWVDRDRGHDQDGGQERGRQDQLQ